MPLSLHKYHYRSDAQLVADLLAGNEAAVKQVPAGKNKCAGDAVKQ